MLSSIKYGFRPFRQLSNNDIRHKSTIATLPLSFDKHAAPEPSLAPPMIILHGLFGSKANNRLVAKQLAKLLHRNVFCLDLRNFGHSPHSPEMSYPLLAADVEAFIDSEIGSKCVVLGHSMGAKTAMAVALRRPDLVSSLVLVDNAPWCNVGVELGFISYIRVLRDCIERKHYTNIKDIYAALGKVEPDPAVRQFLLTNMKRNRDNLPITSKVPLDIIGDAVVQGMISSWPFDYRESRFSGPSLFIRGTKSLYVPDEVIPDIGLYFPDFEMRDIAAGHWVISECPREFVLVVTEFIARREDL